MSISRKVTSRGSVHGLVVIIALCIAMPAVVAVQGCNRGCQQPPPPPETPTPTPTAATYKITYKLRQGTKLVCPNPPELINVRKGDTVIFSNASPATITITPDPANAFDQVSTDPVITLGPGQQVSCKVSQGLDVQDGMFVKLPAVPSGDYTAADCQMPGAARGPGMQVNP